MHDFSRIDSDGENRGFCCHKNRFVGRLRSDNFVVVFQRHDVLLGDALNFFPALAVGQLTFCI
jgi:hypothetical protein